MLRQKIQTVAAEAGSVMVDAYATSGVGPRLATDEALAGLLASLMHYADRERLDFGACLRWGSSMYAFETGRLN